MHHLKNFIELRGGGRTRCRWEDNIKMDLQEVECELAQDRNRWRALVKEVMKFRVPLNAGNILTSCKPVSFSGRTLFHSVRGNASECKCVLSSCTAVPIDAFNISKIQRTFRFHWRHLCLRLWFVRKLNLVVRKFLVCVYSRRRVFVFIIQNRSKVGAPGPYVQAKGWRWIHSLCQ